MVYSKSKNAVRRVRKYLDQMLEAEKDISFPASNPTQLAYQIREGISASQFFPDTQKFAQLDKVKFLIRVKSSRVACELRELSLAQMREEKDRVEITINEVKDVLGIIGAGIKHKANRLVFPDANAKTIGNPAPLENWASKNGYTLVIDDTSVTLEK